MKYIPLLLDGLREHFNQPRKGIHISDIILCPRYSAFEKLNPGRKKTKRELNFFTAGEQSHGALQYLLKKYGGNNGRFEAEKEVWFDDLVGHIDIYDKTYHIPIEIKTARLGEMKKVKPHYISQLEAYMTLTKSDEGTIMVQLFTHFEDEPFVEFEHTMTEEQRKDKLLKLKADAILLKEAIATKDPSIARHIYYDRDYNWLCENQRTGKHYCPYWDECEKMRIKENAEKLKPLESSVS